MEKHYFNQNTVFQAIVEIIQILRVVQADVIYGEGVMKPMVVWTIIGGPYVLYFI